MEITVTIEELFDYLDTDTLQYAFEALLKKCNHTDLDFLLESIETEKNGRKAYGAQK